MSSADSKERLYVVVRRDLAPGLQMAQALHAGMKLAESASSHGLSGKTLSVVWAEDLAHLQRVYQACTALIEPYDYKVWTEEDLGHEMTSLAIAPSYAAKRVCAGLPAAFSI